jgi:glycosidase
VYELNPRTATPEGTLAALQERLPELRDLGAGILWLMPIHPRGVERAFGSAYCVRDHRAVDPCLGDLDDLRRLIAAAHGLDMRIILDWAGRFTAWDHHLMSGHPEFYRRDEQGNVLHSGPWKDIVPLDYEVDGVRRWAVESLKYWISEADVDGFRVDVALMYPDGFWECARPQLETARPLFLLAEAEGARFHPAFDMTYDWALPPVLWSIADGEAGPQAIAELLEAEASYPEGAVRMRHLVNHDTAREGYPGHYFDGRFDEDYLRGVPLPSKYGPGLAAFAVVCATLPGKPMLLEGMEEGRIDRATLGLPAGPVRWWRELHSTLLNAYRSHRALHRGGLDWVEAPDGICAYRRFHGDEEVWVVLNLSPRAASWAPPPGVDLRGRELLSGAVIADAPEALDLEPWDYRVFSSGPADRGS